MNHHDTFGFVVRAKNEEQYVGFALQSIFDCFGNAIPVVVINNESTDSTKQVINLFPKKHFNIDVFDIPNDKYTPGTALNVGISCLLSKGCSIAGILSAHCEIVSANTETIVSHLSHNDCFAVMGKQIPVRQGKKIKPRYIWANFEHQEVVKNLRENTLVDEERYFLHNAFSFIKIEYWKNLMFDQALFGKEDRYWAKEQIALGKHFIFDPSLTCRHFWTKNGATWR